MQAIEYVKSVPRYLFVRYLARQRPALCASFLSCIRLVNVLPPPLPTPEWVRVRPLLSGICGSDLATITAKGDPYFSPLTSFPFVLGHEVVGEVVECGDRVERFPVGSRVVLHPPLSCRTRAIIPLCEYCQADQDSLCINTGAGSLAAGIQTGYCHDTGGAWSGSFVAHQQQLHLVPEGLANSAAVLAEPFGCALEAVLKASPKDGQTALIVGFGTMGALTLVALRSLEKDLRVVVVAKHLHQQHIARQLGADRVVGVEELLSGLTEELRVKLHRPEFGPPGATGGADISFDCVGAAETMDTSLRFTRAAGQVVMVGMPGNSAKLHWMAAWHKELSVLGSYSCNRPTFCKAILVLPGMSARLEAIVGAKFSLAQYKKALAAALKPAKTGALKITFEPSAMQE